MKAIILPAVLAVLFAALPVWCQEPARSGPAPIFHVDVIESTITAINYQYRQGPTTIDFRGTVLMPEAKGEAIVESKRGHTEIVANFEHLLAPQRFGPEYLTYTLWAVTPDGGLRNLAEIVPGHSDKAGLRVSTDLQAFGLIVTAEPYSATRRPSNVVVLENRARPDTEGKIEQVQAKYELMPRGEYTWHEPAQFSSATAHTQKVSMDRYEAILEIYEAQNALGIAQAAQSEQYAPQTFAKARQLFESAQRLESSKAPRNEIVQNAREAVETAEDARMIAERRREEETLANARTEAANAKQALTQAQQETQNARSEADEAQSRADAEHAARERAEADAEAVRRQAEANQAEANRQAVLIQPKITVVAPARDKRKSDLRMGLLDQLNGVMAMRDTARGLMATLPDSDFTGTQLHPAVSGQLARLAAIVMAHPGLRIDVRGNSDTSSGEEMSSERANAVRRALMAQGFPGAAVTARGLGDTDLFGPNTSAAGRAANRRVEIVISGDPIGDLPFWDHPYTLAPSL
ncbi:MAG TPA: OmpA family protein [Bryobacteraceae bacterium]|jgi:flagellar motor protein MotB